STGRCPDMAKKRPISRVANVGDILTLPRTSGRCFLPLFGSDSGGGGAGEKFSTRCRRTNRTQLPDFAAEHLRGNEGCVPQCAHGSAREAGVGEDCCLAETGRRACFLS